MSVFLHYYDQFNLQYFQPKALKPISKYTVDGELLAYVI